MSAEKYKALVVDDESDISRLLSITIQRMGIDCVCVASVEEAKGKLAGQRFQLCLTDMQLPDGTGMEIVEYIQGEHPDIPVAVITAYGSVDMAVQALKRGAFDFVNKPIKLEQIRGLVKGAIRLLGHDDLGKGADEGSGHDLVGDSGHMRQLQQQIGRLARSQAPVFICGESGVGKELVARAIHERGPRADKPFLPVNCGAIPAELIESELFGHIKGSFTGADSDRDGMFQSADGGSLFLDEIADLPLAMQVKLLRAIQERKVRPIGTQEEVTVDVRIISAAQRPLADLVAAGSFRQDLYYRLNVIDLLVPPLRDRAEDIPRLLQHFVEKISARNGHEPPAIGDDVRKALSRYSFPGNVRELENILERCLALSGGEEVRMEDLRLNQAHGRPAGQEEADRDKLGEYIEDKERQKIVDVLDSTFWNRTNAAKKLGISMRALRYRMQKLGLTAKAKGGNK